MPDQGQVLYELYLERATALYGPGLAPWSQLPRPQQDMWRHIADDYLTTFSRNPE